MDGWMVIDEHVTSRKHLVHVASWKHLVDYVSMCAAVGYERCIDILAPRLYALTNGLIAPNATQYAP